MTTKNRQQKRAQKKAHEKALSKATRAGKSQGNKREEQKSTGEDIKTQIVNIARNSAATIKREGNKTTYSIPVGDNAQDLIKIGKLPKARRIEQGKNDKPILDQIKEPGFLKDPITGTLNRENYGKAFYTGKHMIENDNVAEGMPIMIELLKTRPDDSGVIKMMAAASANINNYHSGIKFAEEAIRRDPNDMIIRIALGGFYSQIDQIEKGQEILLETLKNPRIKNDSHAQSEAYAAASHNYSLLGERDKATDFITKACDLELSNVNHLYAMATQVRAIKDKNNKYFKALDQMQKDNRFQNDPDKAAKLYYALFDAYDQMKDYETAFDCAMKGAEAKLQTLTPSFPPETLKKIYSDIIEFFTHPSLAEMNIKGCESDTPVFVLGMPRSGTTLLEQIVLSHPDMEGVGEDAFLNTVIYNMSYINNPGCPVGYPLRSAKAKSKYLSPEALGQNYVDYIQKKHPNAKRIINKSISNYIWIPYLRIAFPNAKFIHIRRNAMDSCISTFSKNFTDNAQDYSYDLETLGHQYKCYVEMMDKWNEVYGDHILNVTYEDIVANLEGEARRIIDFLDVEWSDKCLEFHKAKSTVRTASIAQVRKPIYTSSVGRWKRYGPKVIPLIKALDHAAPPEALAYMREHEKSE